MSIYKNYNPNIWSDRKEVIQIIDDLRYGKSFEHFKKKYFDPNRDRTGDSISDENKKRLYVTKGAVDEVISKLVAFCPILNVAKQNNADKDKVIREILNNINWNTLNTTIYDILESKGDCFLYYYFEETTKEEKAKGNYKYIPYVTIIPTEEISDIVLDKFNRPTAYVWKTKHKKKYYDYDSNSVKEEQEKDIVIVFEKGKVTMLEDSTKKQGLALTSDKKGDISVLKTNDSPDSISDMFSIIHIKSNSVPNCAFSRIPADKYIDDSLRLDQIESDMRGANRIIGYPNLYIIDGQIVAGSKNIGGVISIKTDRDESQELEGVDIWNSRGLYNRGNPQAQIKDVQISNDLRSMVKERDDVYDSLHEKAGLTPPSMNQKLSSSDSSKVYQQINRRMEQKIQIYVQNIIEGFKPFFKSSMILSGHWDDEKDVELSFSMPTSILRDSAYDTALTNSLMLKSGEKTIQQLKREQGYGEEEVERHIKELNQEIYQGKSDIRIIDDINSVEVGKETDYLKNLNSKNINENMEDDNSFKKNYEQN